ncbi:MAG: hypothetical protein JWP32_2583 [Schumannella sp.]|nr:hypothetical protein [Schumannella sp.]
MIKDLAADVLEINAHHPGTIEEKLNAAVSIAYERAVKRGRHGILVTQHGYSSYTVAVSAEVPYGETRERRQWRTGP